MPTPFESAQLNLRLFDLRREAVLREGGLGSCRFNPDSFADLVAIVSGDRNASVPYGPRYWDIGGLPW